MNLIELNALLAAAATEPPASPMESLLKGPFPMLILMMVMLYFIMIRPQQKRAKEHANLLKTLKSGDRILTNGGIVGVVISVKDKTVSIRSADTKLEILKSAVTEITERSGDAAES